MFDHEELARDETFRRTAQMQRDVGVDVRMLYHQLIPEWLRRMVSDFVVFDRVVSYEMTFNAWGVRPATVRTLLSSMPDRIRGPDKQFGQLWQAANTDPPAS